MAEEKKKTVKKSAVEKLSTAEKAKKADAGHVAEVVPELMQELGFDNVKAIAHGDKVLVNIDLADLKKMQEEKEEIKKLQAELKKQQAAAEKPKKASAPKKESAPKKAPAKPAVKEKPAPKAKKAAPAKKYHNRLHEKYVTEVLPKLVSTYGNVMAVPKIEKVIVNMGLGDVKDNTKSFEAAVAEIGLITGQKPVVTKAKKSISNFKLRQGQRIGAKVTLRGEKMYMFLDKLISVAIPRIRDFRGLNPKSFDKFGNYSMGITEQLVFPEISYDKVEKVRGMDLAIVTTANDKAGALELLKEMGFPFRAN